MRSVSVSATDKSHLGLTISYSSVPALSSLFSHQLLIRVAAFGINRADVLQRKGLYPLPPDAPTTMGLECSGWVVGRGTMELKDEENKSKYPPSTHVFSVGDALMCLTNGGSYSTHCVIDEFAAMRIPNSLSVVEAASLPEAFLTAYQILFTIARVQKDDVVLVHAGASGVGIAAIQLCRSVGAHPIVTCGSQSKVDHCVAFGAIGGVDYHEGPWSSKVLSVLRSKLGSNFDGVNVIMDCIGSSYSQQNFEVISVDGRWVSYATMGGASMKSDEFGGFGGIMRKRIQITGTTLRSRSNKYKAELVRDLVQNPKIGFYEAFESKTMKPFVDSVFEFNEGGVRNSHERMEMNANRGKIIVKITESNADSNTTK